MKIRKIFAWLFFPLTIWYAIGVSLRNFCFTIGILKERIHRVTTIGVGNLCMGGSGKTPHADYLIKLFQNDYRVALLSRGYKRTTKGFVVASDDTSAEELGDEPYMLYKRNPGTCVAVCENRNEGIKKMMSLPEPPQIIVLDDVFQHRYIRPSVNILLTEYGNPFFKDCVLPFGNLRESRRQYRRANIIIVTKTPPHLNYIDKKGFCVQIKAKPHQQVFFTEVHYLDPIPLNVANPPLKLSELKNVLFVSGIANPQPAVEKLRENAAVTHLPFADHHKFTKYDFGLIANTFEQMSGEDKVIITTEKDAVRIAGSSEYQQISHLPVYYLPIEVQFLGNDGEMFNERVFKTVRENVYYLKHLD